jgi:hypothetical protein
MEHSDPPQLGRPMFRPQRAAANFGSPVVSRDRDAEIATLISRLEIARTSAREVGARHCGLPLRWIHTGDEEWWVSRADLLLGGR